MARSDEPSTEILPGRVTPDRIIVEHAPRLLIGRSFGKFTIVERLGRGGSGEVFRAEQAPLGRSAVIKVLRREVSAVPNRVERFLREARLASRLDHPYAAHVYAFGAEPDGVLWIAMEYVRGSTIDELISRRGPMPPAVFGPLFGRLCEVVHTAHELGIVHRDIKGGNVMVIERAGELLPKLLDFGIAKGEGDVAPSPGVDGDGLTGHGSTLGSPQYMSPEQWERPSEVDARADIYALGVLAYRCVSGSLPFRTLDRAALGDAHLHITPPPITDAPAAIAQVVLRALAKRPQDRWQTALAFAQAVRRAVGGSPPEVVPILDPATRDTWIEDGPQPIADAIAHLAAATTTIDADAALRDVVAITCRWLAVLSLSNLPSPWTANPNVRESARAVVGRDDGAPWLSLARAAIVAAPALDGIAKAIAGSDALAALADRLDDRDRARSTGSMGTTAAVLAAEVVALADALRPLEPLLTYKLVVGRGEMAESWQGTRRRDRDRVVVWGEPLGDGEVALLDSESRVVAWLSPLALVAAPMPSAEPELFLLWRSGRGAARLVAAPWGFERDDDAAGQRLAALSTEDSDTNHELGDNSPYPGLLAYGVDDAAVFVGREREIESLANRLLRAPMIAVLGPSGVGKSSFIHAGMLPRLTEHYQLLTMRPGRHPLHALASLPSVSRHADDPQGIVDRLRELGDSASRGVVVVIDQLEELVTLCADADERRIFADTLAKATDGPGSPVRVVVTLRDDFATVLESEAAFRGKFDVFVLGTPPPEALRRIVIEPAKRAAVAVDPRVVDDMVAEVAGRPASLPLLSFTASQLWATRDRTDRRITHDAYLALGGVAGALSAYADQVYGSLARRDQEVVRDLFARLVASDGTRIPAPRRELEELPGATPDDDGTRGMPKARGVLAHLIDARLLTVREDEDHDIVEIVHECLAERWPRLARWRSEDAADRDLLGDVRAAARRWHDGRHRPDLLWRGEALAELRRLAGRTTAFTDVERAFADAADRAEKSARRLRRRLVGMSMAALVAVAGVMAYLSVVANKSRAEAEENATHAHTAAKLAEDRLTASLVAQGKQELNDGHALRALAYFGEAMRRHADSAGLREMISIASRGWKDELLVQRTARVISIFALPAGGFVAGDQNGHLRYYGKDGKPDGEVATEMSMVPWLRPAADGRVVAVGRDAITVVDAHRKIIARIKPKENAMSAAFGPGSDEITSIERDAINIYGLDGKLRRSMPLALDQGEQEPAFDPTGRYLYLGAGSTITLVDIVAMTTRTIATDALAVVVASDDGSAYAYLDKDHAIHVITEDGRPIRTIRTTNQASHLVFSPTGDRLAAISEHDATIYNREGTLLTNFAIEASPMDATTRDDDLWTASNDGVVRHYHNGALVASLPTQLTEIEVIMLSGDLIATVGSDTTLAIVRASAAQLVLADRPCARPQYAPEDIGISYLCGDHQAIYVGRHLVGEVKDASLGFVTMDPASGRGAFSSRTLTAFESDGKPLATTNEETGHTGAIAFEDKNHLLVAELDKAGNGLWRWELSTGRWEHIVDLHEPGAVAMTAGGIMVGFVDGHVTMLSGGREVRRLDLHDRVEFITTTRDKRIAAVQLGGGGTAIVDTTTGVVLRQLVPSDAVGSAPTFDGSGELLLRASRGTTTIWDRTNGDYLVFDFDLMRHTENAIFGPGETIEIGGRLTGVIDIPRDTRPPAEIVRDIECKVPLRVANGRLEPSQVDC
ncbi:MAG TPA: serine/threonine-protein kinase, partial [Kofleriaceae bacterium]|nr:serine/threonine-protein kinase [Kofleriaceae bacterium]